MAAEDLPVEACCKVLDVSVSGYYARLVRPLSDRAIRHAWLTNLVAKIHTDSRQVYGIRRVHAELTLGHALLVGREQVALVMRRAGLRGLSGRPAWRRVPNLATAADLVDRQFTRNEPNRLWVTDITRAPHP